MPRLPKFAGQDGEMADTVYETV